MTTTQNDVIDDVLVSFNDAAAYVGISRTHLSKFVEKSHDYSFATINERKFLTCSDVERIKEQVQYETSEFHARCAKRHEIYEAAVEEIKNLL